MVGDFQQLFTAHAQKRLFINIKLADDRLILICPLTEESQKLIPDTRGSILEGTIWMDDQV